MAIVAGQLADLLQVWLAPLREFSAEQDPQHLLFMLWATTQHYADFAVQVEALTGQTLANPAFFEQTVAKLQAVVLRGVGPR